MCCTIIQCVVCELFQRGEIRPSDGPCDADVVSVLGGWVLLGLTQSLVSTLPATG